MNEWIEESTKEKRRNWKTKKIQKITKKKKQLMLKIGITTTFVVIGVIMDIILSLIYYMTKDVTIFNDNWNWIWIVGIIIAFVSVCVLTIFISDWRIFEKELSDLQQARKNK